MGTDIHMLAEIQMARITTGPVWHTVGRVFKYPYYRDNHVPTIRLWPGNEDEADYISDFGGPYTLEPYCGRNYSLFAILAGVRNGCDFQPIAEPRGVPEDASAYTKDWLEDYHTPSWLTLAEILDFDWDQVAIHTGVMSMNEYIHFTETGKAEGYCASVGGQNVRIISNALADTYITDPDLFNPAYHYYTEVHWEESYRESAGNFLTETVPELEKIRAKDNVVDLRIVFGFDS